MVFETHDKSSNSMMYVGSDFGHREIVRTENIFILLCQNLCSLAKRIYKHKRYIEQLPLYFFAGKKKNECPSDRKETYFGLQDDRAIF